MELFRKNAKKTPRDKKNSFTVILAGAGSGTRMGGVSKPLIPICDKPAIYYSLSVFSSFEEVTRIIICAKKEDIPLYENLVKKYSFTKVCGIIEGGESRQETVSKAFRHAFSEKITDFVAIHDAARPLITKEEVQNAINDAKKYGCAVCACVCRDTVKRSGKSGFINESVDRTGLYLVQTPQIFSFEIYSTSLALAEKNGISATDDSSLVQDAGFSIKLCETSAHNIKLTYPEDTALAQMIIKSRKQN